MTEAITAAVTDPNNDGTLILKSEGTFPASEWIQSYYNNLKALTGKFDQTSGLAKVSAGGTGVSTATQNQVFAAPSGASGAPGFRTLVANDVPATLNATTFTGAVTVPAKSGSVGSSDIAVATEKQVYDVANDRYTKTETETQITKARAIGDISENTSKFTNGQSLGLVGWFQNIANKINGLITKTSTVTSTSFASAIYSGSSRYLSVGLASYKNNRTVSYSGGYAYVNYNIGTEVQLFTLSADYLPATTIHTAVWNFASKQVLGFLQIQQDGRVVYYGSTIPAGINIYIQATACISNQ
jgi:hypothetical protein